MFCNSFQFMPSSLANLASNFGQLPLNETGNESFPNLNKTQRCLRSYNILILKGYKVIETQWKGYKSHLSLLVTVVKVIWIAKLAVRITIVLLKKYGKNSTAKVFMIYCYVMWNIMLSEISCYLKYELCYLIFHRWLTFLRNFEVLALNTMVQIQSISLVTLHFHTNQSLI